ncbi:PREDICTED: phospholipid scramblase family member 5-like isoform X2 [Poecilia mexicana]|uniref:phospholipid scramblase family member 5-like isoform X2 n=1 Tax=Poecilia mexicana TaxID=48701 RepID=UPI00072E96D5|nr:PREDICTED: phospholipid scramblase family member 5-like isoform X2 [Poecilia mexicana]
MSAVTSQPPPFGPLEREKHIQGVFRAFKNRCGPSCECQTQVEDVKSHQVAPDLESEKHSSDLRPHGGGIQDVCMQPPAPKTPEEMEQDLDDEAGLQFLSALDTVRRIHVTARPDLRGPQCVSRKIYSITTGSSKSQMFVAVEESSCMCLHFCGPARACSLQGFDYQGQQVFYFERPLRVDACCLGCCLMEMRAYSSTKHLIGTVCQRWSMFTPLLEVCDPQGASRIQIQGPCCPFRCFANQQFQIVSNIGEQMGTIWKKWPGFSNERNTDHEYFGLEVPQSLEPHTKLLLLAATFLLNHMFFEMS